jgi:hypothetical protein
MPGENAHELTPTHVDLAAPVVALIHELRPDLPLPVIATLVVQALDEGADAVLDAEWARQRQTAYPTAIKAAHRRHTSRYAESAPRTLEDIGADHMTRPHLEIVR